MVSRKLNAGRLFILLGIIVVSIFWLFGLDWFFFAPEYPGFLPFRWLVLAIGTLSGLAIIIYFLCGLYFLGKFLRDWIFEKK